MELSVFPSKLNIPPVPSGGMQKPPMKRWKKILISFTVLIVILLSTVLFGPKVLSLLWGEDDPLTNDVAIRPGKVVIRNTDNAYLILASIPDSEIYRGQNNFVLDYTSGKTPWNDALALEVVTKNAKSLNQFTLAAKKPQFQIPAFADSGSIKIDGEVPYLNVWRTLSQVSAIRAEYLARKGNTVEALEEAEKSVMLGQRIQDSQGNVLVYLVGTAIKNNGLLAFQRIAFATDKKFADTLLKYVSKLKVYTENANGLKRAFEVEYLLQVDALNRVKQGNDEVLQRLADEGLTRPNIFSKNNFYFKPNQTQNTFYEQYKDLIARADGCGSGKAVSKERYNFSKLLITENAIGKLLASVTSVAYDSVLSKRCLQQALLSSVRLTLALRVYDFYKADIPKNLSVLVPDYIDAIPRDPFIDAPLVYSEQRRILYSVGPDGWDTGGNLGQDWQTASDPTFSVDFSKKVR